MCPVRSVTYVSGPRAPYSFWSSERRCDLVQTRTQPCAAVLHNPRYAGVFVYGRSRTRKSIDGEYRVEQLPREERHTFLLESHPAYISWEDMSGTSGDYEKARRPLAPIGDFQNSNWISHRGQSC